MFNRSSALPFPVETVFEYHARTGAIDRLIPIWERIRIQERSASIEVGARVALQSKLLGVPLTWLAEHTQYEPPTLFEDTIVRGPFRRWVHRHIMTATSNSTCTLEDSIDYQLPFAPFSQIASGWVESQIDCMFRYRHATTNADLRLASFLDRFVERQHLRIGITGSNGLIGNRLCALASVTGHQVVRIERASAKYDSKRQSSEVGERVSWDRKHGFSQPSKVENLDAVIHLGAYSIAEKNWSPDTKKRILESRVEGTSNLVRHLSALDSPPAAMISASGVGIYGDCGNAPCEESHPAGIGFLPTVATAWEAAAMQYATSTDPVDDSRQNRRVAIARLGMVLHPWQGALGKMLPLFRWGIGGRLGNGNQYWNWIHVDDAAAALLYLACDPSANGPYNLVAPHIPTNLEFSESLAKALHRPCLFPVPAWALRLAMGEMANELLLSSTKAIPTRLQAIGFPYRAETLEGAWKLLLPSNRT